VVEASDLHNARYRQFRQATFANAIDYRTLLAGSKRKNGN
jgi:hypothetical protein